jgi:DNA (cytosine-5)-methyltransferase 1
MKEPLFIVIDLFCGAGGTTTGFVQAELEGNYIAKVIACVNHDPIAIKSHWANHPEVKHFEEDIRTLDLKQLVKLVDRNRVLFPNAKTVLWASLECTNFSKAKGGQPRDADSRTLANHLDRYVTAISPDYIQIENVVEFMSWGPLDDKGKPVSRKNGSDWMRWRKLICSHGYTDEWKELNSANYGAYTSRNRLFGVFARPWLPIIFPQPTHSKKPEMFSMYDNLKKWMPVKDVLDFADEGVSIFTRKKALSDKTLERIYAGLVKYVAKGDTAFISKYFSGKPSDKNKPVDVPADSITTKDHHSLVQPEFLVKYNSMDKDGNYYPPDLNAPAPVLTTQNRLYLATPKFLTHYYSNGGEHSSVDNPSPTISTRDRSALVSPEFLAIYNGCSLHRSVDEPAPVIATNDRFGLVQPEFFIDKHFGNHAQNQSINQPAGTLMPNDKHRLVECEPFIMPTNFDNKPKSIDEPAPTITAGRRHHYIVNPSHGGHTTSTDAPCPVIVARQDKAPLYLVLVENGSVQIGVYAEDSEICIRIKQFMVVYNLVDIKMRMLRVHELLRIQGFPQGYELKGNQSDQKKFIGNSVVPLVVKSWTEALAERIIDNEKQKVA